MPKSKEKSESMCCEAGPEPSDPPASFTSLSRQDCRHTSVSTSDAVLMNAGVIFWEKIKHYQTIFKNYCEISVVTSIQDNKWQRAHNFIVTFPYQVKRPL